MFSSIASFLPSLNLNGSSSSSSLAQPPNPGAFDPTDNREEQQEAFKQEEAPQEDDASAKKGKTKGVNETFIIVRPPPAKSNHPLNLQVQLVPPAARNTRQSLDESSDGGASTSARTSTSTTLTRTASNRSDTSSYGSTASFTSTNSSSSSRRTIIPLYNLQAHNVMTNTIVDAGTDAKIAKFQKRGIELIDLALFEPVEVWSPRTSAAPMTRNSRPVTPDPSAHTASTADSSVVSLSNNPKTPQQIPASAVAAALKAPTPPKRNLFGKMFKKKDSTSPLIPSPAPQTSTSTTAPGPMGVSPRFSGLFSSPITTTATSPAKTITPTATPTPRSARAPSHSRNSSAALSPASALSIAGGKLRGRSSSPNVGLGLLQVPLLDDPNVSTGNLATPMNASSNASEEQQKILRPPVLGIHPTLSFSYAAGGAVPEPMPLAALRNTSGARALMYVWFVRKWYKRRGDESDSGGLLGMVGKASGKAGNGFSIGDGERSAGEGVEVRFEWKRTTVKARARKGRDREGKRRRAGQLREGESLTKGSRRLSIISHHSISTNLSTSEDGHRSRDRSREPGERSGVREREDNGDDSDPEDSETPWVCTLKIRRTGPGTSGSTFTARSRHSYLPPSDAENGIAELGVLPTPSPPQVLRLKVATLSPTPHHPKVVAMLKVPYPLPDVEVERMGVVKRATGPPGTRAPPTQWAGLTLTAEEIKDVVCSTAMWLVVREGFGGIGKVSRKGDGWRIRA